VQSADADVSKPPPPPPLLLLLLVLLLPLLVLEHHCHRLLSVTQDEEFYVLSSE